MNLPPTRPFPAVRLAPLRRAIAAAAVTLTLAVAGCRGQGAPVAVVTPVPAPDLSRSGANVQQAVRDRLAAVDRLKGATPDERGKAYGELGMYLMAAEYFAEAEIAFADAEALQPTEMRWPYYLAHLHRVNGNPAKSTAAFERAVARDGHYAPALVWLGIGYLDAGRIGEAEALFDRALAAEPNMVAAHAASGRAALARKDYATAVSRLERALAIDPGADAAHYSLALAYRGLGQLDKAQVHLRSQASEIKPQDPRLDDIDVLLETPVAHEVRGARALTAGRWDEAADEFRRGLALAPGEPALRHKLGTALAMKGDVAGAIEAFRETVRRSPGFAKGHYSLGLILLQANDVAGAMRAFEAALAVDANYVEARVQLAETLRRQGRSRQALPHYERALQLDTRVAEARFGYAMALVDLGRWRDARTVLEEGMRAFPERIPFVPALARILAAAPDAPARDGQRAVALLQALPPNGQQSLDFGLAMAMALAEAGRFDEAAMWQREAMGFAAQMGDRRLDARLAENLRSYEQRRPCRRPWSDAEPMEMHDQP